LTAFSVTVLLTVSYSAPRKNDPNFSGGRLIIEKFNLIVV
jgi:hypothetical protein